MKVNGLQSVPFPRDLRNALDTAQREWDTGKDYKYPAQFSAGVGGTGLPPSLVRNRVFYQPKEIWGGAPAWQAGASA